MDIAQDYVDDLRKDCPIGDSWFDLVMVFSHFVPNFLTVTTSVNAYRTRQVSYKIASIGLLLNTIANYTLSWFLQDPAPIPACGGRSANPPYSTQHAAAFVIIFVIMKTLYRLRTPVGWFILGSVWLEITVTANIHIGYNSRYQAIAGVYLGVLIGAAYMYLTHFIYVRHADWWLTRFPLSWINARDTVFRYHPEFIIDAASIFLIVEEARKPDGRVAEILSNPPPVVAKDSEVFLAKPGLLLLDYFHEMFDLEPRKS